MALRDLLLFSLSVAVHGSGEHDDVQCTPHATLPHPVNCSKFYVCDELNNPTIFQCPEDYLYNPDTTRCDLAEIVTCFNSKTEDKERTPFSDKDEDYEGEELHKGDFHKEFYLVNENNSSKEKPDVYESSTKGEYEPIQMNAKESTESEESDLVGSYDGKVHLTRTTLKNDQEDVLKGSNKKEELVQKTPVNENVTLTLSSSEVSGESEYNINDDNNGHKNDSKTSNDEHVNHPGVTDIMMKREITSDDSMSNGTSVKLTATNKQESDGHALFVSSHSTINDTEASTDRTKSDRFKVIKANVTSILQLTKTGEQIGNWTEKVENDWTDLVIFWQHPTNIDFKGSVHFQYPSGSMSDESEMKGLLLEILRIGGEEERLKDDTVKGMNKEYSDISYESNKGYGDNETIIEPVATGQEFSAFEE